MKIILKITLASNFDPFRKSNCMEFCKKLCKKKQFDLQINFTAEPATHYTEVRFASLLSGGFTTVAVINPPEKKLANRTAVQCGQSQFE